MIKLLFAASIASLLLNLFGVSWDSVENKITGEFPDVSHISTDEVLRMYDKADENSSNHELPVIIDVREGDEFAVSHLSRAINWTTLGAITDHISDRNTPIIVYCSVGYRSARMVNKLQQRGFTNVHNLKGSIFEWANKGYPLVTQAGTTDKVHPFNRAWGSLVSKSLHRYP